MISPRLDRRSSVGCFGNIASKAGVNYTYDTTHKHAVASLSNGNTYTYDQNGNMITRHVGTQTFNFAYDAENRLVTVSGSATASFVYDGDGARILSTMDGATTIFVGSHYEKVGTSVTKYYMAGASRVAMRKDGTVSYLLGDHLGSTSLTTDASGNRTSELRYKAWGETRFSFGTMPTKYQFTGQYADSYINLLDYGSRRYDPELGRFIQPDSIVPNPANSQDWDRYSYVRNNPVRYTDPSGHMCSDPEDSDPEDCDGADSHDYTKPNSGRSGSSSSSGGSKTPPLPPSCNIVNNPQCLIPPTKPTTNGSSGSAESSYCGGGPNGWYNGFDCASNIFQDLALGVDFLYGGTEAILIIIGCFGGVEGCMAGAGAGEAFFNVTGGNAIETVLSTYSTVFTILADLADDGQLSSSSWSSAILTGIGAVNPDPIVDFGLDLWGSAYNHGFTDTGASTFFGQLIFHPDY